MFTGIIEAQGQIRSIQAHGQDTRMGFEVGAEFMNGVSVGDSIAVNGVCLTAIELGPDHFHADLSAETLGATTAAQWLVDQRVNLEPALTLAKPLGGHLVSGHVDGIGHLRSTAEDARSLRMNFELPAALACYVARKGSITIDGISLTVNAIEGAVFGVNHDTRETCHNTSIDQKSFNAAPAEVPNGSGGDSHAKYGMEPHAQPHDRTKRLWKL